MKERSAKEGLNYSIFCCIFEYKLFADKKR